VLRSLSDDTADFAPQRLRHPRRTFLVSIAILAVCAGTIAYFATRTEKGPGPAAIPRTPNLSAVTLSGNPHDYDPEGGDGESSSQVQFAIDGVPTTAWDTETYQGGFEANNKNGVGLYVSTGSPVAARQLDILSSTPGYKAAIYASDDVPEDIGGWTKVSDTITAKQDQPFRLHTGSARYRNYLFWISELPEGGKVTVKELALKK
jgi:hypothetical protein